MVSGGMELRRSKTYIFSSTPFPSQRSSLLVAQRPKQLYLLDLATRSSSLMGAQVHGSASARRLRYENNENVLLLLDGVRVRRSLGSVDDLVGEALGDRLDVAEGRLADTDGDERDSLVNATEGGDIDGLATDGSLGSNASGVLTGSGVDDGVHETAREEERRKEERAQGSATGAGWHKGEGRGQAYT